MIAGDGLRALEQTTSDTSSYYWLGFVPEWRGDDTSHDIRLKVRGKAGKVRARRNFSDLSRESEVTNMVEGALRLGEWPVISFYDKVSGRLFYSRLGVDPNA